MFPGVMSIDVSFIYWFSTACVSLLNIRANVWWSTSQSRRCHVTSGHVTMQLLESMKYTSRFIGQQEEEWKKDISCCSRREDCWPRNKCRKMWINTRMRMGMQICFKLEELGQDDVAVVFMIAGSVGVGGFGSRCDRKNSGTVIKVEGLRISVALLFWKWSEVAQELEEWRWWSEAVTEVQSAVLVIWLW